MSHIPAARMSMEKLRWMSELERLSCKGVVQRGEWWVAEGGKKLFSLLEHLDKSPLYHLI